MKADNDAAAEHRIQMPESGRQADMAAAAAPEKWLNRFVRSVALIERVGNALGTLAFTWATVILLGGYPTKLRSKDDFAFATIIVFLEAASTKTTTAKRGRSPLGLQQVNNTTKARVQKRYPHGGHDIKDAAIANLRKMPFSPRENLQGKGESSHPNPTETPHKEGEEVKKGEGADRQRGRRPITASSLCTAASPMSTDTGPATPNLADARALPPSGVPVGSGSHDLLEVRCR
uniref:DUF4220 domain-containing protein n=1 Tax=Oryza meridionalis TaxID=40149 RepID=A0A0E0EFE8_9ORYZ